MVNSISRTELAVLVDSGKVTVVETLGPDHYASGHIPGAIHIGFREVADRAPALLPDKAARIVTYCSNTACRNSDAAANHLVALGYTNVAKYAEGKDDWKDAGLPFEYGL